MKTTARIKVNWTSLPNVMNSASNRDIRQFPVLPPTLGLSWKHFQREGLPFAFSTSYTSPIVKYAYNLEHLKKCPYRISIKSSRLQSMPNPQIYVHRRRREAAACKPRARNLLMHSPCGNYYAEPECLTPHLLSSPQIMELKNCRS